MARTIVDDGATSPTYVEDSSGPAVGLALGLLIGIAAVVLGVLFLRGTFTDSTPSTPDDVVPTTPAQESSQPSSAPSP